jgi:uncharacterized membrane protein YoaK (UPF0700 family)
MSDSKTDATHVGILLAMTFTTGMVDAASFLALGHVFTANMTGNIVFLGFALGGVTGLSASGSFLALMAFLLGALAGGKWMAQATAQGLIAPAIVAEAGLLAAAAAISALVPGPGRITGIIAATALAMGLRNAVVRKIAIPDMTTTVLTLTLTGIAADSTLAGGGNPRWRRRVGAVGAMFMGALVGAQMVQRSLTRTLVVCAGVAAACAAAHFQFESKRSNK